MALPKIKHVLFDVTIPSTNKKVKFRPFTVQEEKIIVSASTTEDTKEILNAISQIINNCAVTDDFDADALSLFDIEWIFVQLRANSVNNVVDIVKTEDGKKYIGQLDLKDVKVVRNEKHTNKILVSDDIGIIMKYPNIGMVNEISVEDNKMGYEAIHYCIEKVYDSNEVYTKGENFDDTELEAFISSLPSDALQKVLEFFDTMPTIETTIELVADDGSKKTYDLKGINDFF